MRANQARFVTVCQQMLVLGAVLAALVPATQILNLDVVTTTPGEASARASATVAVQGVGGDLGRAAG